MQRESFLVQKIGSTCKASIKNRSTQNDSCADCDLDIVGHLLMFFCGEALEDNLQTGEAR
eukprot:124115-Amphidinium_carterae.1